MESQARRRRPRLTYANVLSTIALFCVLGGTGYAAIGIPNGSVGKAQIKPNAIDSSKVKNGSLLKVDFKAGQLPAGAKGATGATGPAGPTGATGPAGANFTILTTLGSGQTLRGMYDARGGATEIHDTVTFRIPLAQPIPSANVHYLAAGASVTAQCPGVGQALAGHLCVYETAKSNATFNQIFSVVNGAATFNVSPFGFAIFYDGTPAPAMAYGEWAVTAP